MCKDLELIVETGIASCCSLDSLIGRVLAISLDENGRKQPVAGLKHDAKTVVIKCYNAHQRVR